MIYDVRKKSHRCEGIATKYVCMNFRTSPKYVRVDVTYQYVRVPSNPYIIHSRIYSFMHARTHACMGGDIKRLASECCCARGSLPPREMAPRARLALRTRRSHASPPPPGHHRHDLTKPPRQTPVSPPSSPPPRIGAAAAATVAAVQPMPVADPPASRAPAACV